MRGCHRLTTETAPWEYCEEIKPKAVTGWDGAKISAAIFVDHIGSSWALFKTLAGWWLPFGSLWHKLEIALLVDCFNWMFSGRCAFHIFFLDVQKGHVKFYQETPEGGEFTCQDVGDYHHPWWTPSFTEGFKQSTSTRTHRQQFLLTWPCGFFPVFATEDRSVFSS